MAKFFTFGTWQYAARWVFFIVAGVLAAVIYIQLGYGPVGGLQRTLCRGMPNPDSGLSLDADKPAAWPLSEPIPGGSLAVRVYYPLDEERNTCWTSIDPPRT